MDLEINKTTYESGVDFILSRKNKQIQYSLIVFTFAEGSVDPTSGGSTGVEDPTSGGITGVEAPTSGGITCVEDPTSGGITGVEAPTSGVSTFLDGSVQLIEEFVEFKKELKDSLQHLVDSVKTITGKCNSKIIYFFDGKFLHLTGVLIEHFLRNCRVKTSYQILIRALP